MTGSRHCKGVALLLGITALILLAGCLSPLPGADTPEATPTPTLEETPDAVPTEHQRSETPEPDTESGTTATTSSAATNGSTEQNNATLVIGGTRIYNETEALLGVDEKRPTIEITTLELRPPQETAFDRFFNLEDRREIIDVPLAHVTRSDEILLSTAFTAENLTSHQREKQTQVLVHEFVHHIQFENNWTDTLWNDTSSEANRTSTEHEYLTNALIEGGAAFATTEYARDAGFNETQRELYERLYDNGAHKLGVYYYGAKYFDAVLDDPANIETVYDDPPTTTTELMHPERDEFTPTPVNFTATTGPNWTPHPDRTTQTGELYIHATLTDNIDIDTAENATAGYANDRLFFFTTQSKEAFAWSMHWESEADAEEFAAVFNKSLEDRDDDAADDLSLRFAGNQTTVILAGGDAFTEAVEVVGEDTDVQIRVGKSRESINALTHRTAESASI